MKEEKSRVNTNDNIKMTTEEAIELIDILKERVSDITLKFPKIGDKIEFEVQAVKDGKKFIVNINRGKIDIKKCTYQGRTYINSIALLRLDVTNSFHINPDGTKIQGPHLHIYSEENEMREAIQFDMCFKLDPIELKEKYVKWLEDEIVVNKIGEYLEITSPFLDRYNDYLQVYAKLEADSEIIVTDDSYVINNLRMSGIDINSAKRKQLLESFLNKYSVKMDNDALVIKSGIEDFPQKILFLMQAMLNIDDMFMLSQNKVASIFLEDVTEFLDKKDIFYSKDVNFIGKSGFLYSYEYLLQRTKNKPERLCKVINNPNKQNFQNTIFMWNDTKETRDKDSQLIVFLNDENKIEASVINGFKNYNVNTIYWTERENYLELLGA